MNISTLEAYVEQQNKWAKLFNKNTQPLSLLNAKDRQAIASMIDAALSPENLSCDGELPPAEVNRRYRELTRCAQELKSIDPSVVIYEF
jgi:hypothetical protein